MKRISVVIPMYYEEEVANECYTRTKAVLSSFKEYDYEIIFVNDGSKDKTLDIFKKIAEKDRKIKVLSLSRNFGHQVAVTAGLKYATGKYIMFLDSDDYFELDMVEKMLDKMNKNGSDICVCDMIKEYEDGTYISTLKGIDGESTINNLLLSLPSACNKLFKKTLIKEQFLEKRYYEDLGTVPLIITNCKSVSYVHEGFYHYIQRQGSIMHQHKYNKKLEDIFYIMERLYSNKIMKEKYFDELEFLYIKHLLHDASLRFLNFNCKESKHALKKITLIMKEKFPNWKNNKYTYLFSKKELLLTKIIYKKFFFLYNLYRKVTNK